MKEQANTETEQLFVEIDKRELVNIDLYGHEMKLIAEQLKEIAKRHPRSKEIQQKFEQFKKALKVQQKHLEKFRKNCEPEEINKSKPTRKKGEKMADKSFFENLNDFENQFKSLRQEANDFVNHWL